VPSCGAWVADGEGGPTVTCSTRLSRDNPHVATFPSPQALRAVWANVGSAERGSVVPPRLTGAPHPRTSLHKDLAPSRTRRRPRAFQPSMRATPALSICAVVNLHVSAACGMLGAGDGQRRCLGFLRRQFVPPVSVPDRQRRSTCPSGAGLPITNAMSGGTSTSPRGRWAGVGEGSGAPSTGLSACREFIMIPLLVLFGSIRIRPRPAAAWATRRRDRIGLLGVLVLLLPCYGCLGVLFACSLFSPRSSAAQVAIQLSDIGQSPVVHHRHRRTGCRGSPGVSGDRARREPVALDPDSDPPAGRPTTAVS